MMLPRRRFLMLAAAPLALAACQSSEPARPRPTFYDDLASPTARVDERRATDMISSYRARFGIAPLALDPELSRIAAIYARQMADADKMTHTLDDGSKLGPRLKAAGYQFEAAGENIAAGYHTLAEAFSGWRESPRHDRGMKDPEMTVMGIGTAFNPNSKYKVFWCLIFARPRPLPGVGASPSIVSAAGTQGRTM